MNHDESFEKLISDSRQWRMVGWNFSKLEGRWIEGSTPWNYQEIVSAYLHKVHSFVDLGTGGGELVSSITEPFPILSLCTEGYPPNVKIAHDRLKPLGFEIIETFCDDNSSKDQRGALPFKTESLDLIIDRHESFVAKEVYRTLRRHGTFITQQVGSMNVIELNDALGVPPPNDSWNMKACIREIENAGLRILASAEAGLDSRFKDVGAIVCYCLSDPWQFPEFSIEKYVSKLKDIHDKMQKNGELQVTSMRFIVEAKKE